MFDGKEFSPYLVNNHIIHLIKEFPSVKTVILLQVIYFHFLLFLKIHAE